MSNKPAKMLACWHKSLRIGLKFDDVTATQQDVRARYALAKNDGSMPIPDEVSILVTRCFDNVSPSHLGQVRFAKEGLPGRLRKTRV